MNEKMSDLMYRAGLTAQGCWDQLDDYDRKAIERFGNLVLQEVLLSLEPNPYEKEIEHRVDQAFYAKCEHIIKKHFGLDNVDH